MRDDRRLERHRTWCRRKQVLLPRDRRDARGGGGRRACRARGSDGPLTCGGASIAVFWAGLVAESARAQGDESALALRWAPPAYTSVDSPPADSMSAVDVAERFELFQQGFV